MATVVIFSIAGSAIYWRRLSVVFVIKDDGCQITDGGDRRDILYGGERHLLA